MTTGGVQLDKISKSLPVRGAWIEICAKCRTSASAARSLPVRGAWIEIYVFAVSSKNAASLPVRGAWIEIALSVSARCAHVYVAPRAGSVD